MLLLRLLGAFLTALIGTVVLSIALQAAQGFWDPLRIGPVLGWEVVVMFGGLLYFAVRDVLEKHRGAASPGSAQ